MRGGLINALSTVQSPCKEANWLWQFASSYRLMWSCSHFIDSWRNMIQLNFKSSKCFCILIPAVGCTSTCPANIHVFPTRVGNAGWSLALCLVWTHREAEARRPVEKTNFGYLHLWPYSFSHHPDLLTVGWGGDVDQLADWQFHLLVELSLHLSSLVHCLHHFWCHHQSIKSFTFSSPVNKLVRFYNIKPNHNGNN